MWFPNSQSHTGRGGSVGDEDEEEDEDEEGRAPAAEGGGGGEGEGETPSSSSTTSSNAAMSVESPLPGSPLIVFVNSKSGDGHGERFLRRFRQILNPAQVFDLASGGPRFGLEAYRGLAPLRLLICGGDGSVGWVLREIDHLQLKASRVCDNFNNAFASAAFKQAKRIKVGK